MYRRIHLRNNNSEVILLDFRTDLAVERREMIKIEIDGVNVKESENDECKITLIDITTEGNGAIYNP